MNGSTLVIGAGTNLGGRWSILRAARDLIASRFGALDLRVAPVWETPPLGPPQPDYLNTAFALPFDRPLGDALDLCRAIERDLGRERRDRWGPRTLDLDLLWHASRRSDTDTLTVPHPGLRERTFALDPLLALVPDAVDPTDGVPLAQVRSLLPPSAPGRDLAKRPEAQNCADALAFAAEAGIAEGVLWGRPGASEFVVEGPTDPAHFAAAVRAHLRGGSTALGRVAVLEHTPERTRAVLILAARR